MFGPRRSHPRVWFTGLAFLLLGPSTAPAVDASRDEIRAAVREVYEASEYQRELPRSTGGTIDPSSFEWSWLQNFSAGGIGSVIQILGVAIAALLVFLLFYWLIREWPGRKQVARTSPETPDVAVAISDRPVGDAEALAAAGDYAAAIHVLLLRTIEELRSQLAFDPRPSLTSREIVASAPLPGDSRSALSRLVRRVERHYFGTVDPTRDDYDHCIAIFRELRAGLGRTGVAQNRGAAATP